MQTTTKILIVTMIYFFIITSNAQAFTFNAGGSAYPTSKLPMPYYIDANYPPANSDQLNALQEAFKTWTNDPTSKVAWEYKGMTSDPTLLNGINNGRVSFSGYGGNGSPIVTQIGDNNYITGFTFRIQKETTPGLTPEQTFNYIKAVAMHEIGHAMGLGHSNDPNAVMYPAMNYYNPPLSLGSDDIAGAAVLYPAGNERPIARISASPTRGSPDLTVMLDASSSSDIDGNIVEYIFKFSDGNVTTSSPTVSHIFTLPEGVNYKIYSVNLQVKDDKGGIDFFADVPPYITVTNDFTPPPIPEGLIATPGSGKVSLQWNAVTDPNGVQYKIYRSLTSGGPYSYRAISPINSFIDISVTIGTTYYYVVSAIDGPGNESNQSAEVNATPNEVDTIPPSVPTNLTAAPSSSSQIDLSWTASADNVGVTGYKIFRDGVQIATGTANSYQDTGLTANITYTYTVSAYDAAGNQSGQSTPASATTLTLPNNPPVLNLIGNKTVNEGQLLQFSIQATDSDADTLTYSASNLPSGASFNASTQTFSWTPSYTRAGTYAGIHFEVSDGKGGIDSEDIAITVNNVPQLPNVPSGLSASAISSSQIKLTWIDNSTNETGFKIERKTGATGTYSQIAIVGANVTTYSNIGLTAGTTYYYRVRAYNSDGDSNYSNEVSATTASAGDAWDPTDNTGSSATQLANPTTTEQAHGLHTLSSTDLYDWFKVYLTNGARYNFNTIGGSGDNYGELYSNAAGTTRVAFDDDSGGNYQFNLNYTATSTAYYYLRVRAYSIGNVCSYTLKYKQTSAPAQPPTAPSNATATATSSSQINLRWMDNSNNETGFKIEKSLYATTGFTQVATVGANIATYTNTGLTKNKTYYYRVRAYNTVGNSSYTNTASATTPSN